MNPIKPSIKTEFLPILVILILLASSFYFYFEFPSQVIVHWDPAGQPESYASRELAAFAIPAAALVIYILMLATPYLDPKKRNYKTFKSVYHIVKAAIALFLLVIYLSASLNNLGYAVPINIVVPFTVGLLFILIGLYLTKIQPNWFFGIRTPWTLSSASVWHKTHKFGSKLFIIVGILILGIGFVPQFFNFFMAILILAMLAMMVYSYFSYKQ